MNTRSGVRSTLYAAPWQGGLRRSLRSFYSFELPNRRAIRAPCMVTRTNGPSPLGGKEIIFHREIVF